jgi:hypothetical protein
MAAKITTGQAARCARLFAAILLFGGMTAAPVAHPFAGPEPVAASGSEHGESRLPDTHNDCPTCITLTTAAAPVVTTVLAAPRAGVESPALPMSAAHDRDHSAPSRARAPPHG